MGELVPKRLALAGAEPIAIVAARPIAVFARITAPLVWLLDASSDLLLGLIGARGITRPHVTAEELHLIVAEASRSGAIEEDERAIITGIMRLAERPVREVMTPRTEIDWIEAGADEAEIRESIAQSPHSMLAVADGSPDTIIGVVKVREVLAEMLAGRTPSIARLARKAEIIPDQLDAMDALRLLQQSGVSMGLVHDEYGHLEGIVTPTDLLTAIVGSFASHQDEGDGPLIEEGDDGSLLVSGALPADALADRLDLDLPDARDYATAAGYVLSVLRRLPDEGDAFTVHNWRFEVVEMDGRRIERLRVSPLARLPLRAAAPQLSAADACLCLAAIAGRRAEDIAGDIALGNRVGLGVSHGAADARLGRAGMARRGGFHRAARRGAAKHRVQSFLLAAVAGGARRAGLRRGQREIGRHHQRRLPLHGELVGPHPVEQPAMAAARQHKGGTAGQNNSGNHAHQNQLSGAVEAGLVSGVGRFSRERKERARIITTPMEIAASARLNTRKGRNAPKCKSA